MLAPRLLAVGASAHVGHQRLGRQRWIGGLLLASALFHLPVALWIQQQVKQHRTPEAARAGSDHTSNEAERQGHQRQGAAFNQGQRRHPTTLRRPWRQWAVLGALSYLLTVVLQAQPGGLAPQPPFALHLALALSSATCGRFTILAALGFPAAISAPPEGWPKACGSGSLSSSWPSALQRWWRRYPQLDGLLRAQLLAAFQ